MRSFSVLFLLATLGFIAPSQHAQAQSDRSQLSRDVAALRQSLLTVKLVPAAKDGTHDYFDVLAENVCNGQVERIARNWASERFYGGVLERVVLLEAVAHARSDRETTKRVPLLLVSNSGTSSCQPVVALAVPRNQGLPVSIELTMSSGITEREASVGAALVSGVASAMSVVNVSWTTAVSKVLKEAAGDSKRLREWLRAKGTVYSDRVTMNVGISHATYYADDREMFTLRNQPREYLLSYRPGQPYSWIPRSIDEVSEKSYDDIVAGVIALHGGWAETKEDFRRFCRTLRSSFARTLRNDSLAIALGLYAHETSFIGDYSGQSCLYTGERRDLMEHGFIPRTPAS